MIDFIDDLDKKVDLNPIKIEGPIELGDGQKIEIKKVGTDYIDFRRTAGYTGDCRIYIKCSDQVTARDKITDKLNNEIKKRLINDNHKRTS